MIAENTVLSFDVRIEDAGEIVGFGFDTDNNLSPEYLFQLAGTQTWGLQGVAGQYSVGGGYVHYEIAVVSSLPASSTGWCSLPTMT